MVEDKDNTEDADDSKKLVLKLDQDDSALIVRTDGSIELISRELQGKEENYVGDIEDLNRTFTLVLAFAAAIENERLYHDIFQNIYSVSLFYNLVKSFSLSFWLIFLFSKCFR